MVSDKECGSGRGVFENKLPAFSLRALGSQFICWLLRDAVSFTRFV